MKRNKSLILLLIVIISALALTACSSEPKVNEKEPIEETSTDVDTTNVDTTVTVKHELDEVTVNKNPKNVIVFDYGVLDTLDKMGIEVLGLPKSNIPSYLEKYNDDKYVDIGTLFEPNFEKIFELKPDIIIISGRQAKVYDELKKLAPTLYLSIDGANYIDSFENNMKILGEVFDKEDFIEKEIKNIQDSIKSLNEKAAADGKSTLIVMANDGNLSAYGEGSRFGIIHKEFGLTPVDKDIEVSNHGKKISFEYIVEQNPDYLFVIDRGVVVGADTSAQQVLNNDLIKSTTAYKNDKIIYLDAQVWYVSSGGLTGTMKMIEEVKSALE
ncbi:siderophore ABC transporter substrate-binding protein [Tissierella sp. MSJ-40]|uniref:Siderophore ABC transporter substrate-binding protein n=1 Tax=Tissierella simiarum TaxID=2841534 RepID=A0ABS6E2J7_9FIRM|nr:siderophore ABC transporter substrate-binding protein [Tissierella simiarum]MBU5437133.1 siderophore ABC transporter substrate-binding protein [Tissierella simiarum]